MKLKKSLLLGATLLASALCSCGSNDSDHHHSDSPKDEGRKFAKLQYELEQAYQKYGYDSDEAKEISEKYEEYAKKLQRKFEKDTTGRGEFVEVYNKKLDELRGRDSYPLPNYIGAPDVEAATADARTPESDGEKAAELEHAYFTAETPEAQEKAQKDLEAFAQEVQKLYGEDEAAQKKFEEAYSKKYEELMKCR